MRGGACAATGARLPEVLESLACLQQLLAAMSPLVVRARVGSLWCQKCGRLLCEAHRNQHSCEMEMQELERRRRVDVDEIREGIRQLEEEKEQRAADADALKRAEAGAKAARYRMWKDRRRHVVWCPASF